MHRLYNIKKEDSSEVLKGALTRIQQYYTALTNSEQLVADYIFKNSQKVVHYSTAELAVQSKVSEATIIRFCQAIGYKGFKEFKVSLAQDLVVPKQFIPEEIKSKDNIRDIASKITHSSLKAIKETHSILDFKELEKAVDAICNSKRVEFYGVGHSGLIAQEAHLRMARIGIPAISYIDPHVQANSAALLEKGNVAVGISLLGKTADILYSLKTAREAGATIISLTKYSKNPVSELADINLFVSTENSKFRTGASRLALLYLIDILFALIAVRQYEFSLECIEKTNKVGIDKRVT
ncbi:MAG: MurR/RpiR family transcriptional regulator [Bacillota bacterium]